MPGQLASNLQILTGRAIPDAERRRRLNAARQQHLYLQSLADQYQTLQAPGKSADGTTVGLPALDQQIQKLKTQLADLSSHYTDRHPDVRKLKEQIAEDRKNARPTPGQSEERKG